MARAVRWALAAVVVTILVVVPFVYFRMVYDHAKRLRVVVPGRVYRSGQLTAEGFRDALRELGIRTVLNVQDEVPDPDLDISFWDTRTVKEKALCEDLGVRYVHLMPDLLDRRLVPPFRPKVLDPFLAVLDDPASYPVLIHCHAGLHRTGVLTAVYRMEYQGWDALDAWREMRANGFGAWVGTAANEYVRQYVLTYRRGVRQGAPPGTSRGQDPAP
jgi:protein tyrosine/serine phosphatase